MFVFAFSLVFLFLKEGVCVYMALSGGEYHNKKSAKMQLPNVQAPCTYVQKSGIVGRVPN